MRYKFIAILSICLFVPNLRAVIINDEDCLQELQIGEKDGHVLIKESRYLHKKTQENCLLRIYCSNANSSLSKRFDISVLHFCSEKGKKDDTKNSYYDFGNSVFGVAKYPKMGVTPDINSVLQQGFKVYIAGYGYDDKGKIWSRVSINKENVRVDNRDSHNSFAFHEKQNGIFRFEKVGPNEELFFYKLSSCKNKNATKLKLLDGCFLKEKFTYPKYDY